jgi:hypothetical protein
VPEGHLIHPIIALTLPYTFAYTNKSYLQTDVSPAGIEPAFLASEANTLSVELWGRFYKLKMKNEKPKMANEK